ncbi:hypothetical protein [Laribacter hongkongensis]|uniref:hypothetical protein n=1 Tax=Laribacter hongkongensis TaxID=168471 RepID=UPI000487E36B|nr:hypothetical protein [Laribacter hongkongensis]
MNQANEVAQKNWFEDKCQQVSPCVLVAFGIEVSSRYGKSCELVKMLWFASELAINGLEQLVEKVEFDSKTGSVFITLSTYGCMDSALTERHAEKMTMTMELREIAAQHFSVVVFSDGHEQVAG